MKTTNFGVGHVAEIRDKLLSVKLRPENYVVRLTKKQAANLLDQVLPEWRKLYGEETETLTGLVNSAFIMGMPLKLDTGHDDD